MSWLNDRYLAAAAILGTISFITVLVLLVAPSRPVVPKYRRRPHDAQQASALSGVATKLTTGVDKVLRRRGSGLAEKLEIAGIKMPASNVVVLTGSAMIAAFALGLLLGSLALAVVLLVLVPVAVWAFVLVRTDQRRAAFATQLDETAQMLAGSLRSGYSFAQALSTVAREAATPTNDEFTRITNELRLGRPLADSMEDTAERMKSEDFSWIGQAVAINREVGGNLADVLDGVSHTIRERAQLRRQVDALSGEGKLSAIVLIVLPFAMAGIFAIVNPPYIGLLFTRPLGWFFLGLATLLLIIGSLWLRAVVRIKY
ncbi:type II secretion system F family protein [Propionibacteriaceae bacterium G1746]|uniref:type II secretion system F family protein n=1 Tax=Aestuariimicrobium sp. G57 TaxID=3418485 RepID=UPI003C1847C5